MKVLREWLRSLKNWFRAEKAIQAHTIRKDDGQVFGRLMGAIQDYQKRYGRSRPRNLVIGVDLYETLVANAVQVAHYHYDPRVSIPWVEEFASIPLIVVPEPGVVWVVGTPKDVMMHESWPRKKQERDRQ